MILVDNTLWSGRVLEAADADDDDTVALRAFNDMVAADAPGRELHPPGGRRPDGDPQAVRLSRSCAARWPGR